MPPRRTSRWLIVALAALIPLALVTLAWQPSAWADKVDSLIGQLLGSSDYKVRLSAALTLAKATDPRAVPAFVKALDDDDKTVRGVAAAALGKQVTCDSKAVDRSNAVVALKRAAAKDGNDFVRKQALKAFEAVEGLGCGASGVGRIGSTYVNVGAMAATVENADALKKLMRTTVLKTFSAKARTMTTDWPGGQDPSASQLSAKKVTAFHVDGTLNEMTVDTRGSTTTVSCKVSMLLATYPEKSMFGFLKGGAQVQGGTSANDVRYAKEDCVTAVIEDLIARKIIPTIQSRVTQ
jgi:hypothetical protein